MAQTLEALSRHSDTLTSIRGIVRTMKTLSAINATPYEQAAQTIEAYHQTILHGFAAFAHKTGNIEFASTESPAQRLTVIFGSDHGLCGNYNEVLADKVKNHFQIQNMKSHHLLCIGARMRDALDDQGLAPDDLVLPPASADGIGRLASDLVNRIDVFSKGHSLFRMGVTLAFTQRGKHGLREPVVRQLLPLDEALFRREDRWPSPALPDYSMAPDTLLVSLIRNHIFASIFRASAEAMVTENAARLALMQQAEKSVDEQLDSVKGELRSVRQAEITNELMDVFIGFEALKKKRP